MLPVNVSAAPPSTAAPPPLLSQYRLYKRQQHENGGENGGGPEHVNHMASTCLVPRETRRTWGRVGAWGAWYAVQVLGARGEGDQPTSSGRSAYQRQYQPVPAKA
eukprot:100234-Rhodomonas_salina.3